MPSPIASIIYVLAVTATATAETANVMRREEKNPVNRMGVVSARGHFIPNSELQRGTFDFQLKSILLGKCLELDGERFSTKTCNATEPKQKFTAEGIDGPSATAVATSVTTYNNKLFCWSGAVGVEAKDTCEADNKKFRFWASGVQCFRVKLFLNNRCLTTTMAATEDSCTLDASQFTAETSASSCPAEHQHISEDGLPGGGAEGGEGGEAEGAVGGETGAVAAGALATSTPAPSTPAPAVTTAPPTGGEQGGTVAPDADALRNSNATQAPPVVAPPHTTPEPIIGFRLILKSVSQGTCLRLEGQSFQMATCDATDHQQQFIARGFTEPGQDVIAANISMYNGKILCFDGQDKVEAYDETCVTNFAKIELEPTGGSNACFKVKWNSAAANELCMTPPNNDQDMMATSALCATTNLDNQWTADANLVDCGGR